MKNYLSYRECLGLDKPSRVCQASELETLSGIESHGDLNPIQKTRLAELRASGDTGNPTGEESHGAFNPSSFGGGGGGGGGGPSIPPFTFDWNAAENEAFAKLAPYYKQQLDLAKGNLDVAKQAIESDYTSGKRFRGGEYMGQMGQEFTTAGEENRKILGDLNERGVLFQETGRGGQQITPGPTQPEGQPPPGMTNPGTIPGFTTPQQGLSYSDFAVKQNLNPLEDKQQQRRQAIQRAITRQQEQADTQYGKDIANNTYQGKQEAGNLASQYANEAQNVATNTEQSAYLKYQGTVGRGAAPYTSGTPSTANVPQYAQALSALGGA